jgi:pyruvate/2-oxoglutarate dehydrogenase complex dihydrolipoamide dehydrogenase (E3) component
MSQTAVAPSLDAAAVAPHWTNPPARALYDLVVIGATPIGVAAARWAAQSGFAVALVGGADAESHDHGMPGFSPWELIGHGADVFFGGGHFLDRRNFAVDGRPLRFRRALIAVGADDEIPAAPGLTEIGFCTPDTIANLVEPPRQLLVIGNGSAACEWAAEFCPRGSRVHLLADSAGILPDEDRAAASCLTAALENAGVRIHAGWSMIHTAKAGRSKSVILERAGQKQELVVDEILLAGVRRPRLAQLELPAAGVAVVGRRIQVDPWLRTTSRAILAAGEASARTGTQAAAETIGRRCAMNALGLTRQCLDRLGLPHVVRTDPQLARVGLTMAAADARQVAIRTHVCRLAEAELAIVHLDRRRRVVGATVVGRQAEIMIARFGELIRTRAPIDTLAEVAGSDAQAEAFRHIIHSCGPIRRPRRPWFHLAR